MQENYQSIKHCKVNYNGYILPQKPYLKAGNIRAISKKIIQLIKFECILKIVDRIMICLTWSQS